MKISWWPVYACTDVDEAVKIFTEKVTSILHQFAPIKTIQVRTNYAPWISRDTLDLMKERNMAQQRASMSNLHEDWEFYRQLRNHVTRILKNEKSEWRAQKLKAMGRDPSIV